MSANPVPTPHCTNATLCGYGDRAMIPRRLLLPWHAVRALSFVGLWGLGSSAREAWRGSRSVQFNVLGDAVRDSHVQAIRDAFAGKGRR